MHDTLPLLEKIPFPAHPPRPARHPAGQRRLSLQPVLPALPCRREPAPHRGDGAARSPTPCSQFLERRRIATLDITGGAPELNPHFRRIVTRRARHGRARDRPLQPHDLRGRRAGRTCRSSSPANRSRSSPRCPAISQDNVDRQRGKGVFDALDPRPAAAQRAGLRARRLRAHAQPRLQPAGPVAAAAAGGARGRLQAHPRRTARHRVQPALHARQHADPALRLDAACPRAQFDRYIDLLRRRASRRQPRRRDVPQARLGRLARLRLRLRLQPDARPAAAARRGRERLHLSDAARRDLDGNPIRGAPTIASAAPRARARAAAAR